VGVEALRTHKTADELWENLPLDLIEKLDCANAEFLARRVLGGE
jgi:hypothetical protein